VKHANPTSRRQALKMMRRGLAGDTVNGATLATMGTCVYRADKNRTCIIGLLLTPAQREWLCERHMNADKISVVCDAIGRDNAALLQLSVDELNCLQREFDHGTKTGLKALIAELAKAI
jgi:hypothetical protein